MKNLAILVIFMLMGPQVAVSQQTEHRFYQVVGTLDQAQVKSVMIALNDHDPAAMVFLSDDRRVLQIKGGAVLSDNELRSLITTTCGAELLPGTPDLVALYGGAPSVPVLVPTGDPQADHARYAADVELWNAQNPDQKMPPPIPYVDEQ